MEGCGFGDRSDAGEGGGLDVGTVAAEHADRANVAIRAVNVNRALNGAGCIVIPSRPVVRGTPDVGGVPYKTRLRTHPIGW